MNKAFERPFRPVELIPSIIKSFSLHSMAQQLMTEQVFAQSGRNALTLARSEDLTVVLTVVKAGTIIKEHQAPGPVTILPLFGRITFSTSHTKNASILLESGSAVVFAADVVHSVEANQDSAFLIVIGGRVE